MDPLRKAQDLLDPWDLFAPIIDEVKRSADALDYTAVKKAASNLLNTLVMKERMPGVGEAASELFAAAAWDASRLLDFLTANGPLRAVESAVEGINYLIMLAEREEQNHGL